MGSQPHSNRWTWAWQGTPSENRGAAATEGTRRRRGQTNRCEGHWAGVSYTERETRPQAPAQAKTSQVSEICLEENSAAFPWATLLHPGSQEVLWLLSGHAEPVADFPRGAFSGRSLGREPGGEGQAGRLLAAQEDGGAARSEQHLEASVGSAAHSLPKPTSSLLKDRTSHPTN